MSSVVQNDFIFSRKITKCVFSLNAFHLYWPLITFNWSIKNTPHVNQMFPCCYTDTISALVTCCILDQNQNPHLGANTCAPQSSTPQVQMFIGESWKSSIITEITAACLLDASQIQIFCLLELNYFAFSLGELSLLGYTKAPSACSAQVQIIICDWMVWLPGEKPERRCSWHAGPTRRPLDGICDKAILPSGLVSRQISPRF